MEQENLISVAEIQKELKRLSEKNKEQKKIRACLFNLIVYSENSERRNYFKEIVLSIIQKFPCRIILIEVDNQVNLERLDVSVSSESIDRIGTSIACDQISLHVGEHLLERIPFIVTSLFVTDLPIYLFWGQEPKQDEWIRLQLMRFSNRIIFDTENIGNIHEFSKNMLQILDTATIEVVDVQWAMNNAWRQVLLSAFDNEERINALRNAKQMHILINKPITNHETPCNTQSFYLQAWIASRLGWKFHSYLEELNHICIVYTTQSGKIEVHFNYVEKNELHCGAILNIEIQGQNHFHVSLVRQEGAKKVLVNMTEEIRCLLPYSIPLLSLKRGFNFIREIFYEKPSLHYKNMLTELREIQ